MNLQFKHWTLESMCPIGMKISGENLMKIPIRQLHVQS